MWLGPAPEAPYHVERCFHRWRYILDYSNGQTVNFGAHTNDIAQWGLNMDGTTPVEFEDNGSEFLPRGSLFTAASRTAFRARYANGIELLCETRKSSATKFEGTEGRIFVNRGRLTGRPAEDLAANPLPEGALKDLYQTIDAPITLDGCNHQQIVGRIGRRLVVTGVIAKT